MTDERAQQQTRSRRFTALDKALATLPHVGTVFAAGEPPTMEETAHAVLAAARLYETYLRDG